MNNDNSRIWAFVVYSVLFEATVWGIFGYAVFVAGHSGWWMLLAAVVSSQQLGPSKFGIGRRENPTTSQPSTQKESL